MRRFPPWRTWSCPLAAAAGLVVATAAAADPPADTAALIEALGAPDAAVREQATARLAADVATAADALLAAAESATDPEVALRARWLLDSLPLAAAHDPPAAAAVLARLETATGGDRLLVLHDLLRLDGDAGIEPLARLVRLDRSAAEAVAAAALLAGEWRPDAAAWRSLRGPLRAGLGPSRRPAARFLRALAADPEPSAADCDAAVTAVAELAAAGVDPEPLGILRRSLAALLARAGQRDAAIAEADRLFTVEAAVGNEVRPALDLAWLAAHGLPEAVDLLPDRFGAIDDLGPPLAYAAAVAERTRGRAAEADRTAAAAHAKPTGTEQEFAARLQAAVLLSRWGAWDWAAREYEAVIDAAAAEPADFGQACIYHAESLHDQGRDAEAAATLARVLEGQGGVSGNDVLERLERTPSQTRGRMLYFAGCDAAARGDAAESRRRLEEALRIYPQEVDALIALFRLPDASPAQQAEARRLVAAAAARIEDRIEALPEDGNTYNEYSWLVANTTGDITRAERYARVAIARHARQALELRRAHPFDGGLDSSSYLDTLAHCRAAAGDLPGAIRVQSLAVGLEPHGRILRLNLEAFQARVREAMP
jgi:hypothetical protein